MLGNGQFTESSHFTVYSWQNMPVLYNRAKPKDFLRQSQQIPDNLSLCTIYTEYIEPKTLH